MKEDKHIQLACEYPDIDFDIILRVNDKKINMKLLIFLIIDNKKH